MAYPGPVYADDYTQKTQVQFGGMNHQKSAGDGDWYQTWNLTSDYFPVMASRKYCIFAADLHNLGVNMMGMCGGDSLYFVMEQNDHSGAGLWNVEKIDGKYLPRQIAGVSLTSGEKLMAKMSPRLVIFPDKVVYNETDGSAETLERTLSGQVITIYSGTYMGEPATANCVQIVSESPMDGYFEAGQAVKIYSVKTRNGYEDVTVVIREIKTFNASVPGQPGYVMHLHFYDNTFYFDGNETDVNVINEDGTVSQATGYSMTSVEGESDFIKREVPDLDILFVHENRLWGAKDDTIWASALGDPFTWYNFDTVDTAAWTLDVLSEGKFTGGCSFLGHPVFFKDNHIYKIYGSVPSDFSMSQTADIGVAPGSGRSLVIAGERLYYLSRVGVMVYTGSLPQIISKPAFGDRYMHNGIAGSDGLKYRLTCTDEQSAYHHFVYDTTNGSWHEESFIYDHMAFGSGNLYASTQTDIVAIGDTSFPGGTETDMQYRWTWYAESADYTESSPRRKWVGAPLEIRAELLDENTGGIIGSGFGVAIYYDHDSTGNLIGAYFTDAEAAQTALTAYGFANHPWTQVSPGKRSFICKQIPERTDHYYIKIFGVGRVWIYSIAPMTQQGSSWHGKNGR